jgi:CRISPR-associated endonuclease/helicase Cas3
MAFHLKILPVYSELHADRRIGDVHLLKHQVETLEAFGDPEVDVIFNVAMTGDGKSLAAYLPAFEEKKNVISMYPTNELVQDQHRGLEKYEQRLGIELPHTAIMHSHEITRLMREHDNPVRIEEVRRLVQKGGILLTNPDLIHLMMSHQYGWDHMLKELPFTIGAHFHYFLFDEFHVFGVPQVIAVMNMLGYIKTLYQDKPNKHKKFLFLSATPNRLLTRLLEKGGLRYRKIEGSYLSEEHPGYRRILQPCELELHEISQEAPTEAWIEAHIENIRQFFQKHNGKGTRPKAAILVYSVATARRLVTLLKERLEVPYGITIGENTGLTYRGDRPASFEKDVLVGTTTVDIGVDFRINYLIFEAFNDGSFLQRFGRLGRHEGFPEYQAYALVPRFVLERLQEKLGSDVTVERRTFNEAVHEAFPSEQEFENYTRRWGVVQAAQVVASLQQQKDENDAFTEALIQQYEQFYGTPERPAMLKAMKKYRALSHERPAIVRELQSFRGQSPLSCGVWDTDDHLKTYDLFFLLTNTEFEVLDEAVFMQEVKKRQLEERDFKEQLLYLKVHRYIPERLNLVLGLPHNMGDYASTLHQVQVLNMFTVREPYFTCRDRVNGVLKRLKLPCILSDMGRKELKQRLNLGSMFQVERLQDATGQEYSVAFGQEALLLDSLLFYRKTKGDGAMML